MSEKSKRTYRSPVAWLLGRQLLASLKSIALYTAFGRQIDAKRWMSAEEIDLPPKVKGETEFWFDYIADVGDGQKAVYSVGGMVLSDWSVDGGRLEVGATLRPPEDEQEPDLPRGAFLFVGGDTCYHISDYATLANRFQQPLRWAFEDLKQIGRKPAEDRHIVGIPGNHDYYDSLNGFYLQFRKPPPEVEDIDWQTRPDPDIVTAQLFLKGFQRIQESSYVALKLPFEWRFWGLDTQHGELDSRQKHFFKGLMKNGSPPAKLIVATPEPTTVFGRYCQPDSAVAKSFDDIELARPFLDPGEGGGREELPEGACRLDLSGDVHHYARYFGGDEGAASRYASVVSGGGGAFLHPTVTNFGELNQMDQKAIYPLPENSHREVTRRLLNPWNIVRGGYVYLAGALVTCVLVFGMGLAQSTRDVTNWLLGILGLAPLGVSGDLFRELESVFEIEEACRLIQRRPGFWDGLRDLWPMELGFLVVFLPLFLVAIWTSHRWCRKARGLDEEWEEQERAKWKKDNPEENESESQPWKIVRFSRYAPAFGALLAAVGGSVAWIWSSPAHPLHPLMKSCLVFGFFGVTVTSFVWIREYSDSLVHQARFRSLKYRDFIFLWVLVGFALITLCFGVWRYGGDPLAVVVSDGFFLGVVLLLGFGLPGLAIFVGAKHHDWKGKVGFFLLGVWHLVLQATLPVLLALYCPWWASLTALAVVALVSLASWRWAWWSTVGRWGLLVAWLLLGGSMLAAAFALALRTTEAGGPVGLTVPRLILALVLGAAFSCVWFGWYLAVSVPFNGHNNEAGGGSRLEKYKQMIRFRLTKDDLTGYVIALDDPVECVKDLKPKIVDVFRIRAQ